MLSQNPCFSSPICGVLGKNLRGEKGSQGKNFFFPSKENFQGSQVDLMRGLGSHWESKWISLGNLTPKGLAWKGSHGGSHGVTRENPLVKGAAWKGSQGGFQREIGGSLRSHGEDLMEKFNS